MKNILFVFFVALAFGNIIACQQEDDVLKVFSFNIDTNIGRTEEGLARDTHFQWRVGARMAQIKNSLKGILDKHSPDVINLQEGRKFITKFGDEVDSIFPLVAFLKTHNYQVFTKPYNPTDRAFSYITAIREGKFTVSGNDFFYISKTPEKPTNHEDHIERIKEIKEHNFGEEWERGIFITRFTDQQGRNYRVRNVHLGMSEKSRIAASDMLREDTKKAVVCNPKLLEVTTGDFNSFPDWGGPTQIEKITQGGVLKEVTQNLTLPNEKKVESTFIAFPYDFGANTKRLNDESFAKEGKSLNAVLGALEVEERKERIKELFTKESNALGGHLDRVFQHGFDSAQSVLLPLPLFEDFSLDDFNEKSVKEYIVRHYDDGPAFASDHQPVLTTLTLPK